MLHNELMNIKRVAHLFHAHLLRHGNNAAVAFYSGCESNANTCTQPEEEDRSVFCYPVLCLYNNLVCLYIFLEMKSTYLCFQSWARWLCLLVWGFQLFQHLPPSSGRSCPSRCLQRWRTHTWPLNTFAHKDHSVSLSTFECENQTWSSQDFVRFSSLLISSL